MSPQMYQPAGFRLPARTRGRVIPIDLKRRGLGDAAADYAAIAAKLAPGSVDYQLASGCAANPTPGCAQALSDALSTPYLNATDYANTIRSIAAGGGPVSLTAPNFTGAPAGTSIPSAAQTIVSRASDQGSAPPASVTVTPITATPNIQPVQMAQPATSAQPVVVQTGTPSVGFFSTTILGIPIWLWAVGAVGGYFLFAGGKHGR